MSIQHHFINIRKFVSNLLNSWLSLGNSCRHRFKQSNRNVDFITYLRFWRNSSSSCRTAIHHHHVVPKFIIIMSYRNHRYPWPSLATSPYRSSPLARLQGYIPYPHIAAECMFELVVLLLPGHLWESTYGHKTQQTNQTNQPSTSLWYA